MAKEASDVKPPASVSGTSTMNILRNANISAKPPIAPSKSGGGPPQNKPGK
jgi:hypothetical protein